MNNRARLTDAPLPRLAPRAADSHKGTYGRALLVGGSRGMAGAISLAGISCLRSGAGLVRIATAQACADVVAGFEPAYMTVALADDGAGRIASAALETVLQQCDAADAVALGPGLGRSDGLDELVARMIADVACPLVVDADGLNALASRTDVLPGAAGPCVLTPHSGEFARLVGADQPLPLDDARDRADLFAAEHGVVVVLKGHRTYITDGDTCAWNETGNPGMATGGSGDVLTGMISGLLAQGLSCFDAARLATHVHGLAGDLAARELGQVSLVASDLPRYLPAAFRRTAESSD
ncbi:MAG: NAD(P)H-hydrate dehydratase [Planctomycetales bacterium]|nr:NAD(P)H-hydrate dehydratase [Planctomycetales bacterium]